jgi:hypothetical protein
VTINPGELWEGETDAGLLLLYTLEERSPGRWRCLVVKHAVRDTGEVDEWILCPSNRWSDFVRLG